MTLDTDDFEMRHIHETKFPQGGIYNKRVLC